MLIQNTILLMQTIIRCRMDEKVNDSGFIPALHEATYQGRTTYLKRSSLMMGIFVGVGISQSLLERHTKYAEIIIIFRGTKPKDVKYNGCYLAKMDDFRKSKKKHANGYDDVQRFLSFTEMKKI